MTPVEERIDHENGWKIENAAGGIAGCDAVWPYDQNAAYFGMKKWAELLLAEREALLTQHSAREEAYETTLQRIADSEHFDAYRESDQTPGSIARDWARQVLLPATESAQPEEET